MENPLLADDVQSYINQHINTDPKELAFKKSPFTAVSMIDLITQIQAKQKAKSKLPTWYNTPNILYPAKLSIEQTSSEACAAYKASLIQADSLIDLTGGFGIDCYYFAKKTKQVVHGEMQEYLSEIVHHNYKALGVDNITTNCGDSLTYLQQSNKRWDWIYVDPARRNQSKEKVFFLKDCVPNLPENIDILFNHTNNVLIKTSPLLDIQVGISELKDVKAIHIVALNNEVKELLWILEKGNQTPIQLIAVNLTGDSTSTFTASLNKDCVSNLSDPLKYLYEPNSAVLKTGKFDCVAQHYNINKLQAHSHLYTSADLVQNFAGRSFEIIATHPYNKASAKSILTNIKANITTRNFPLKVEELRKKWKIKDGGQDYIFFTTLANNDKVFICCKKIETPIS